MDNFINDLQKKEVPDDKPQTMKGFTDDLKEPTIEQLEAYVKQHPELTVPKPGDSPTSAISNIQKLLENDFVRGIIQANPEWVNEQIDTYGANYRFLIMPWLERTYPDLYYAINPNENDAGLTNNGTFQGNGRRTQENEPIEEFEPIEEISDEVMDEAIKYMVFCRNKGYTYTLIREKINSKYNFDLTPTVIQKYVTNYEQDQEEKQELDKLKSNESGSQPDKTSEGYKKIQAMYAELTQLRAKVTELEKEKAIREAIDKITNPTQTYIRPVKQQEEQIGLIRKAIRALW